jgi:two-component system, sensor histidine kinase and response regulator
MKGKITVIDDDKDLRSLLQIALRIEGFEVTCYANGGEFMDGINAVEPSDLYVIDINLGGISGFELCQYLKSYKTTKDSFVILISANPEVQQLSTEVKADDHLLKPFSQKELMTKITNLLSTK